MAEEGEELVQKIETGDSIKIKQVLDEAVIETLKKENYGINYNSDNLKLLLMFLSCLFALYAQFNPYPFPDNRAILGVCCACYFILSSVFQFIVTFVDQDKIATTLPQNGEDSSILTIHAQFPKYQEYYTVIIHNQEVANQTTGKLYVGKYFTEEGEFDQIGFANDIKKLLKLFQQKKYSEVEFNHKSKPKAD